MILVFERINLLEIIIAMEEQKISSDYKTVIVGLSGGLNSAVAAMLLKIQKIDLIAVTIQGSAPYGANPAKNFACHIDANKLQKIKDFCHSLNIPHHIVMADDLFAEKVTERWISQKICGAIKDQCFSCHKMRMMMLYEKMIECEAERIVTGHFAKVYTNPTTSEVSISSANDEFHDQSALLSMVPKEILAKLVLPLSDLSTKEVTKLAENFSLNFEQPIIKIHECFPHNKESIDFLESKVSRFLRENGDIYDYGREHNLGPHEGIHTLEFEKEIHTQGRNGNSSDHYKMAKFSMRDKVLEVAPQDHFISSGMHLTQCDIQQGVNTSFPFKAYAHIGDQFYEAMVYPKNLGSVYVELNESLTLPIGERVSCYKKKGKNSKVFLSGVIKRIGKFHFVERTDDIENDKEVESNVDHEKSF